MRIAFFYPNSCIQRPLDPAQIWTSSRGLTGSEGSCLHYALGLAQRGHDVSFFSKLTAPGKIGPLNCFQYQDWFGNFSSEAWDALCAWMIPEPLKAASPGPLRVFNQQVADFLLCEPGWEHYVDILMPLSFSHAKRLRQFTLLPPERWRIAYNGVDTTLFTPAPKRPGRLIWASSHDRGLHWLLSIYPELRQRFPSLSLGVFYNFSGLQANAQHEYRIPGSTGDIIRNELSQRARFCLEALRQLAYQGVETHQSVSRETLTREMQESLLLPYPCDPVSYTETFGVTVLEACACGTVPVLCLADAFEELWGPVAESVPAPYPMHKAEYVRKLSALLEDEPRRSALAARCVEYAQRFRWSVLLEQFETCLNSRGREGLPSIVDQDPAGRRSRM